MGIEKIWKTLDYVLFCWFYPFSFFGCFAVLSCGVVEMGDCGLLAVLTFDFSGGALVFFVEFACCSFWRAEYADSSSGFLLCWFSGGAFCGLFSTLMFGA